MTRWIWGFFYKNYWDIIAEDVHKAVMQFFSEGWFPSNFNSNVVVLIPKTPGADKIEQFRPITLVNFKLKIVTTVLSDRLTKIAPSIVSENQRGFIKGRKIADCICLTSEDINLLDKKYFGGNLALKIDVKKAFDTLDWKFLIKVLHAFGFNDKFCNWIDIILHSAKLSVNGKASGFFACKRGVRQGDPVSPLFFCIAEEVLSGGITKLVREGNLQLMAGARGSKVPSHVLYADDIMIFCKGT